MDAIKVHFVLPNNCAESEVSDIMLQAFEACKQNNTNVSWINESDLDKINFSKVNFVIFQDFTGESFENLKESKCISILGPWCVLVCLIEGHKIPNLPWPIYNMAMYNCVVTCSHLPKNKKLEIKEKVQSMGGCYSDNLTTKNTHLITDSVQSEKYYQAAEAGLKLMLKEWVDVVWEESQNKNVHCTNSQFDKYHCLPFHNLSISSTGITKQNKRQKLCQLITSNGGAFFGNLNVSNTDVLVCYGVLGSTSEKYKIARNTANIHCVTMDWVTDSIKRGYALPYNLYQVKKCTSTPTKDNDENPNFSVMSAIYPINSNRTTLEETAITINKSNMILQSSRNKRKNFSNVDFNVLVDNLDVKKIKKMAPCLDGYGIYAVGFESDAREKLCKILNLTGATRYDNISQRVTHVIVGDPTCQEMKYIKSKNYTCSLVNIHWLIDSIENKYPIDEEKYLINLDSSNKESISSPPSQKDIDLLKSNLTSESRMDLDNETNQSEQNDVDNSVMKQYLKTAETAQDIDTLSQLLKNVGDNFEDTNMNCKLQNNEISKIAAEESCEETTSHIFKDLKFVIINFDTKDHDDLKEKIEDSGGEVILDLREKAPDLAVAPLFITSSIRYSASEIVNTLWILESLHKNKRCTILYYHQPLILPNSKPLKNCVISISNYCTFERNFLNELIEALGGTFQEIFCRTTCDKKRVIPSTHLISSECSGKKYAGAIKWELPVVSKDWLLECANTGIFIPEKNFLLCDIKVPNKNKSTSPNSTLQPSVSHTFKDNDTPDSIKISKNLINDILTPKKIFNIDTNSDPLSQVTPVSKIMEEVRKTNLLGTPNSPKCSYNLVGNTATPETPLGAFIKPNPSPNTRKEILHYINQFPSYSPKRRIRRLSTPLSELKKRFLDKLLPKDTPNTEEENDCPVENNINNKNEENKTSESQNLLINTKLRQLEDMLCASSETNRRCSRSLYSTTQPSAVDTDAKDSQPFTVAWDYNMQCDNANQAEETSKVKIFIISGIENDLRQEIVQKLESLGANVSDLVNYDPNCTHLICSKPARNEKILSCMAAGKWILHDSYVNRCVEAGKFLNEEDFEFGNPKSQNNINIYLDKDNETRVQCMHWWRKEIKRRGYGAFKDMRAIIVANKREPIIRVIEAGEGTVVDIKPPFESPVSATHCLLEQKSVPDFSVYIPLAQQGVYCVNTSYISDLLHKSNKDCILPYFAKFYKD